MRIPLITVPLRRQNDLLFARQRARQIAQLLGFSTGDSTRITTALAEIARNALVYSRGGTVAFFITDEQHGSQALVVHVVDEGPGVADLDAILAGQYGSQTGMGLGITGARALMDRFEIESAVGAGTRVLMSKTLPPSAPRIGLADVARLTDALIARGDGSPFGELQLQNQELLSALDEITRRQVEIERPQRACKHLMGVTNDFLLMAKGQAGNLEVARHAGAARHVISEAAALVAPQAAARTVEITLTETTERVMYLGDSDRVRQVLVNVLGNAVSFTPSGGSVRVTAARVDDPPTGSELATGRWCAIRIEDSGPGIPADKLSRVFEPFVQVAATQAGRRGTGLGLTVSRQLALLMGGDLTAEGSAGIGGGAAFTLWLADGAGRSSTPDGTHASS